MKPEDLRRMQRAKKQMASICKGLRTWITRRNKAMRKAGIKNPEDYPWGWEPDQK